MKEKLNLKGSEYSLQEWVKCKNIIEVKRTNSQNVKKVSDKIIRSPKHHSSF